MVQLVTQQTELAIALRAGKASTVQIVTATEISLARIAKKLANAKWKTLNRVIRTTVNATANQDGAARLVIDLVRS